MIQVTMREWTILTIITTHFLKYGYAPSTQEIAASMGRKAGGGIVHTLRNLHKKGVIRLNLGKARKSERAIGIVKGVKVAVSP